MQLSVAGGTILRSKFDAPSGWSGAPVTPLGRKSKMKKHLLMLLFLSITVALPGLAQQTDSSSSAPSSTPQSASERPPIPADKPENFWDGDDPNFVNLVTHPFANKKYVQRQVGPIRDRLNELDQLTSENSKTIKDVDARATQGIQLASEKPASRISTRPMPATRPNWRRRPRRKHRPAYRLPSKWWEALINTKGRANRDSLSPRPDRPEQGRQKCAGRDGDALERSAQLHY